MTLVFIAVLAISITACNGQCFAEKNNNPNGCTYKGVTHALNTEWETEVCQKCSCKQDVMSCCPKYTTPVNIDKDCISIFDEKNCIYRVVRKDDPCKQCKINNAVG
ncbi:beta-microseminoprotein-like [Spea bombifrons]|uniref:beta-microseminoprotein-like n=1 Tax=Spea bombifrons TaxID=233779 RepID=UPI00234BC167|nr:beta-microseminoprotein-like [Spea bombifrons]